ncbi:MAG: site-specific integrase [Aliarcobacter sp.]|jgi:integrase|nr:site-specific integrase [Aliarcobacter sp.]
MSKFIWFNIKTNKDCTGLFLQVEDDFQEEIKTIAKANDFLKKYSKVTIQLRITINNKKNKKNFTFYYNETKPDKDNNIVNSFNMILDIINFKRLDIKETIKAGGTLREKKVIEQKEENEKITFLHRVEEFLKNKEISARKSTMTNYRTALLLHSKELHNREFSSITIKDIQKIIHKLLELKKAPATVALFARTVGAFFKKHKKEISIDFEELQLPEFDNKVEYKLSLEDTKRIIKVLREYSKIDLGNGEVFYQYEEIKNIFAFSLTGRRISEILNLKFNDLNFETNSFKIPAITAKGKKELDFVIDDYLLEALKSQARLRNIDLYSRSEARIFTYTKDTARVHFQNIMKALELPRLRLHDIRHMLGTTLVQNGIPIQDISRMLGHSSISITEQRYAKTNKDQANRAINAFYNLVE